MPIDKAVVASKIRPLSNTYEAFPGPTKFSNLFISRYPTKIPNLATGIPNLLLVDAILISVAIESSHPPPTQIPLILEIVGIFNDSIASNAPSKYFE